MVPFGIQVRLAQFDAVEAFANALHLAALHGEKHVGRRRIAADDAEFHAEDIIQRNRIGMRAGAGPVVADDELLLRQILHGLHWRGVIGDAHIGLDRRRAEPGEFGGVELRAGRAGQRPEHGVARDQRHGGAVLGRHVVDEIGGAIAAGAFQVLRVYGRIARQMRADMAGDHARPQVVAAAGAEADIHGHRLAGERSWRLRGGRKGAEGGDQDGRKNGAAISGATISHDMAAHCDPPWAGRFC